MGIRRVPVESKIHKGGLVDAPLQHVDTKPVDTKPVDTKPVDTKPVDAKAVDTTKTKFVRAKNDTPVAWNSPLVKRGPV